MKSYQVFIGLEVHVELATKSKMFCGCNAEHFGVEPNTHTCPVCLGLPGALPVPNKKAVEWTILLGQALGCQINKESKFDRKNYFYPDLPKGYQISQYDQPLAIGGSLKIKNPFGPSSLRWLTPRSSGRGQKSKVNEEEEKTIRIRRVHLEEDTGKLQHAEIDSEKVSLVDFNRSGVPLVEIVTEPDFRSIEEVDVFLKKLQRLIRYLKISNADMEKGSMRIEPSISLREINLKSQISNLKNDGEDYPNYRVELKNINSFRFARKALEYEIKRQSEILERGETPIQQTRGWNETKNETVAQREKEEAHDYRYFPEPDIPPMEFTPEQIEEVRKQIPELPEAKIKKYTGWGVKESDTEIIINDLDTVRYFEEAFEIGQKRGVEASRLASLMVNKKVDMRTQSPLQLIEAVKNDQARKEDFGEDQIQKICLEVISQNAKATQEFRSGKKPALQFLIGQVMARLKGAGDPQIVGRILEELLTKN